jgi:hypothetical protein
LEGRHSGQAVLAGTDQSSGGHVGSALVLLSGLAILCAVRVGRHRFGLALEDVGQQRTSTARAWLGTFLRPQPLDLLAPRREPEREGGGR